MVNLFKPYWLRIISSLIHLREDVGIDHNLLVICPNSRFVSRMRVRDSFDLVFRELELPGFLRALLDGERAAVHGLDDARELIRLRGRVRAGDECECQRKQRDQKNDASHVVLSRTGRACSAQATMRAGGVTPHARAEQAPPLLRSVPDVSTAGAGAGAEVARPAGLAAKSARNAFSDVARSGVLGLIVFRAAMHALHIFFNG